MKNFFELARDNIRFLLAILVNVTALIVAFIWMIDSNWSGNSKIEMEPIVTFLALCATLLGLNFVNDKLTKPHIKVKMSMAVTNHPLHGHMAGINVTLENHSIIKAFIKNFKVSLPKSNQFLQFLYDGFYDTPLPKVILEPGEAFSFNMVKKNFEGTPQQVDYYGDFIVTTDTGYKFTVSAKVFREHLATLLSYGNS